MPLSRKRTNGTGGGGFERTNEEVHRQTNLLRRALVHDVNIRSGEFARGDVRAARDKAESNRAKLCAPPSRNCVDIRHESRSQVTHTVASALHPFILALIRHSHTVQVRLDSREARIYCANQARVRRRRRQREICSKSNPFSTIYGNEALIFSFCSEGKTQPARLPSRKRLKTLAAVVLRCVERRSGNGGADAIEDYGATSAMLDV